MFTRFCGPQVTFHEALLDRVLDTASFAFQLVLRRLAHASLEACTLGPTTLCAARDEGPARVDLRRFGPLTKAAQDEVLEAVEHPSSRVAEVKETARARSDYSR